jgi:hypothetical protein
LIDSDNSGRSVPVFSGEFMAPTRAAQRRSGVLGTRGVHVRLFSTAVHISRFVLSFKGGCWIHGHSAGGIGVL